MKCPYCGAVVEEGDEICLNCERPLDYQHLRAEEISRAASAAAIEQKQPAAIIDSATRQKAARIHAADFYITLVSLVALGLVLVSLLIVVPLLGWGSYAAIFLLAGAIGCFMFVAIAGLVQITSRHAIQRVLAGERRIAHWTYDEQEWRQFTIYAWWQRVKQDLILAGVLIGVVLVISLVVLWMTRGELDAFIAVGVALAIVVAISLLLFLKEGIILWLQRRQESHEAYVSWTGIILGDWYTSLSGLYRVDYKVVGNLALLCFFFSRVVNPTNPGTGSATTIVEVPTPRGREAEAEQLVRDFNAKRL